MILLRIIFLTALVITLNSCKISLIEDWTSTPNIKPSTDHFDNLKKVFQDQDHNVYSVGGFTHLNPHEDFVLITKHSFDGNVLRTQTYQCENVSSEMLAAEIYQNNIIVATNNCVIKLNLNGQIIWQQMFDKIWGINDLKIFNNLIFILGERLQVYTLDGLLRFSEDFDKSLWSLSQNNNKIYLAGSGYIKTYSIEENKIYHLIQHKDLAPPAELQFDSNNKLYVAYFYYNTDEILVEAYSANYNLIWKKTFKNADYDSPRLPGAPQLRLINDQKLILMMSKVGHREIIEIDRLSGKTLSRIKKNTGLIRKSIVFNNTHLLVFGENEFEAFDEQLSLVAHYSIKHETLPTAGDMVIDGEKLLIGTSVLNQNSFHFYLTRLSVLF